MKLFIATANLDEIESCLKRNIISGITTNPSILAKEPKTGFTKHIKKIVELCNQYNEHKRIPLSVEVFTSDPGEMIKQAHLIREEVDYEDLYIKIPIGFDELEVIHELSLDGISVNCTCCFNETQLQLGALAGAKYVSLFCNRLIDVGGDPIEVLRKTKRFLQSSNIDCEIIAGSIRKPTDVSSFWEAGADIVTTGLPVIEQMTKHSQTDVSTERFLSDFEAWIN